MIDRFLPSTADCGNAAAAAAAAAAGDGAAAAAAAAAASDACNPSSNDLPSGVQAKTVQASIDLQPEGSQ
jgi:hypothetical protein